MKTKVVLLVVCLLLVVRSSVSLPLRASFTSSDVLGSGSGSGSRAENGSDSGAGSQDDGEYSFILPDALAGNVRGDSARAGRQAATVTVRGNPCQVECKCELVKCQWNAFGEQLNMRVTVADKEKQLRMLKACTDGYNGCQLGCSRYDM